MEADGTADIAVTDFGLHPALSTIEENMSASDSKAEPVAWPPRFHFTAEGIAALFLRKHFGDSAGMPQVTELAGIIESAVQNVHPPTSAEPVPSDVEAIKAALDYAHDCAANELQSARQMYGQYPRDGLGRKITRAEEQLEEVQKAIAMLRSLSKDAERAKSSHEEDRRQAAMLRDAERYRWLRSNHLQTGSDSWIRTGEDLDEAVDAALAAKEQT